MKIFSYVIVLAATSMICSPSWSLFKDDEIIQSASSKRRLCLLREIKEPSLEETYRLKLTISQLMGAKEDDAPLSTALLVDELRKISEDGNLTTPNFPLELTEEEFGPSIVALGDFMLLKSKNGEALRFFNAGLKFGKWDSSDQSILDERIAYTTYSLSLDEARILLDGHLYSDAVAHCNNVLDICNKALNKANKYNFQKERAYLYMGEAYFYKDQIKKSLEYLNKALNNAANDPRVSKSLPKIYYWIGMCYDVLDQIETAISNFQNAIENEPNQHEKAEYYCRIAHCKNFQKKHDEALQFYERALDHVEKGTNLEATINFYIGKVYLDDLKNLQKASEYIEIAIASSHIGDMLKVSGHFDLGCIEFNNGEYTKAKKHLNIALKSKMLDVENSKEATRLLSEIKKQGKPTKKGEKTNASNPQDEFDNRLKEARKQSALSGDNAAAAENGIASLKVMMENTNLSESNRQAAREAWLNSMITLCNHYKKKKKFEEIMRLLGNSEEHLQGNEKSAKECREILQVARNAETKKREDQRNQKGKRVVKGNAPSAPTPKKAGNSLKAKRKESFPAPSDENSGGPSSNPPDRSAIETRNLIRQESLKLVRREESADELDYEKATENLIRKYGEGVRDSVFSSVNRVLFLLDKRKRWSPMKGHSEKQPTYKIIFVPSVSREDVAVEHKEKFEEFEEELRLHPREGSGKPKVLTGKYAGYMSRRFNQEDRLVYVIDDENKTVTIHRIKGHYDD